VFVQRAGGQAAAPDLAPRFDDVPPFVHGQRQIFDVGGIERPDVQDPQLPAGAAGFSRCRRNRLRRVRLAELLRRGWLRAEHRRIGIAAVNRRLLLADRCERLLAQFGARVGDGCVLHGPLVIHNAANDYRNLSIGRNVHIGRLVVLDLAEPVTIADDATVSMGGTILTHADVGERPLAVDFPRVTRPTRIGEGSWVGANATVLPGCDVGALAVVAAGAVVREPVPDRAVVGGVPAQPLREI
jgi:acetyltransferase-like isoleucine patch superfamily enzyme